MTRTETFEIHGPEEFAAWTKRFSQQLTRRELILLKGDLGAGKTFFVTELLKSLGGERGASPSFAIHNHYVIKDGSLEHVDLYRLRNLEDLESTGFWDLFAQDRAIIAVEWANKLDIHDFPSDWPIWEIEIQLVANHEKKRKVLVRKVRD